MLGAGISKDLDFPNWEELVERIAARPEVDAASILKQLTDVAADAKPIMRTLSSVTQMLFSQFRDGRLKSRDPSVALGFLDERIVKTDWLRLIHEELYRDCDREARKAKIHQFSEDEAAMDQYIPHRRLGLQCLAA